MRFRVALLTLCLLASLGSLAGPASADGADHGVVVRLGLTSTDETAAALARSVGGRVAERLPQLRAYLIELPAPQTAAAAANELRGRPAVLTAEPTRLYGLLEIEPAAAGDPLQSQQWHLTKIRAATAWATSEGAASAVIAVVDTGVDYTHPDLAGKVALGPDLADGDGDPMDVDGHGTHVAGIAAATGGNGVGVAGVCPACGILAVKVFPDGEGFASDFDVAEGITWAADHGADVVNLSLGGPGASSVLQSAVDYAVGRNVLVVAAAGNESTTTPSYPGAIVSAIAVSATTSSDTKATFSNFGNWVDIAAPGVGILSTVPGAGYAAWSGTSMATPVVAGAAALAFAGRPGSTAASVRTLLQSTAIDLGSRGFDVLYGHGRLDLARLFPTASGGGGGGGGSAGSPQVTTSLLPAASPGIPYSRALTATGGTAPYTWSLASGSLPPGLALQSNGTIAGTTSARGLYRFTVRVTDAAALTGTRALSILVGATR
jgi:thermitase